jgi:hypothetical protein
VYAAVAIRVRSFAVALTITIVCCMECSLAVFVMEYCPNGELHQHLKRVSTPLVLSQVLDRPVLTLRVM